MMTEYESSVMSDIIEWAVDFYLVKQPSFSNAEMIEDYWQSYISNCEMGKRESGLETL